MIEQEESRPLRNKILKWNIPSLIAPIPSWVAESSGTGQRIWVVMPAERQISVWFLSWRHSVLHWTSHTLQLSFCPTYAVSPVSNKKPVCWTPMHLLYQTNKPFFNICHIACVKQTILVYHTLLLFNICRIVCVENKQTVLVYHMLYRLYKKILFCLSSAVSSVSNKKKHFCLTANILPVSNKHTISV